MQIPFYPDPSFRIILPPFRDTDPSIKILKASLFYEKLEGVNMTECPQPAVAAY